MSEARELHTADPLKEVKAKVRLNLVKSGCPIARARSAVDLAFAATEAVMVALADGCTVPVSAIMTRDNGETAAIEVLALQLAFPLIQERLFKAEAGLRAGLARIPTPIAAGPEILQ